MNVESVKRTEPYKRGSRLYSSDRAEKRISGFR